MAATTIRKKNQKPDTKIYRHFAVVTVAATALLALFADGGKRQELQAQVAQVAPSNDHLGEAKLETRSKQPPSSYSSSADFQDSQSDFGAPMDRTGSAIEASGIDADMGAPLPPPAVPSSFNQEFGVPEETLTKLSPEQRKDLLKRIRQGRYGQSPDEREQQIAKLTAAARQRAGGTSEDLGD
ncbi:MAG: hypothetical protein IE933_00260 [Sphingomonadales bacterium]|nr:hypothetical protein [Sphingomonadales bacterium]MBD3772757.1 hypothetical protein [Paracoccaceae bacterium]